MGAGVMPDFAWMAWTWQTAVFFVLLAVLLGTMTALAARRQEVPRIGILRFPTTRGDRLFVTLLGAAFIQRWKDCSSCLRASGDAVGALRSCWTSRSVS